MVSNDTFKYKNHSLESTVLVDKVSNDSKNNKRVK